MFSTYDANSVDTNLFYLHFYCFCNIVDKFQTRKRLPSLVGEEMFIIQKTKLEGLFPSSSSFQSRRGVEIVLGKCLFVYFITLEANCFGLPKRRRTLL